MGGSQLAQLPSRTNNVVTNLFAFCIDFVTKEQFARVWTRVLIDVIHPILYVIEAVGGERVGS